MTEGWGSWNCSKGGNLFFGGEELGNPVRCEVGLAGPVAPDYFLCGTGRHHTPVMMVFFAWLKAGLPCSLPAG